MSDPESKLFGYLSALPKLGDIAIAYRAVYRRTKSLEGRWVIGSGFQPAQLDRLHEDDYPHQDSETVANTAYLPIDGFRPFSQACGHLKPYASGVVRRRGFEQGFSGPRILIPRGISTSMRGLRASYLEEPLTFQDIMFAVSVPDRDRSRAKLLTALLNSKLLFWFAFHGTASFGSDRPELKQAEMLRLPFPEFHDVQQEGRSMAAASALVSLIDQAMASSPEDLAFGSPDGELFRELDSYCYTYFGLGEEEITLVEDSVEHVIPYVQPHAAASPDLWKRASRTHRQAYAMTLVSSMSQWIDKEAAICVVLEARNDDLALIHLRLVQRSGGSPYREFDDRAIGVALRGLERHMKIALPGNFQLVPDFRLFVGDSLYLVKPLQQRFWLRSAAIADADAIAMELHDAVRLQGRT